MAKIIISPGPGFASSWLGQIKFGARPPGRAQRRLLEQKRWAKDGETAYHMFHEWDHHKSIFIYILLSQKMLKMVTVNVFKHANYWHILKWFLEQLTGCFKRQSELRRTSHLSPGSRCERAKSEPSSLGVALGGELLTARWPIPQDVHQNFRIKTALWAQGRWWCDGRDCHHNSKRPPQLWSWKLVNDQSNRCHPSWVQHKLEEEMEQKNPLFQKSKSCVGIHRKKWNKTSSPLMVLWAITTRICPATICRRSPSWGQQYDKFLVGWPNHLKKPMGRSPCWSETLSKPPGHMVRFPGVQPCLSPYLGCAGIFK